MTQFINDILNDFDAEFGLDKYSSFSQQESPRKPQTPSMSPYRSPRRNEFPTNSSISAQYQIPEPPISTNQETYVPNRQTPIPTPVKSPEPVLKSEIAEPPMQPKVKRISIDEASQIIADLKKERIKDAEKMQQLQTENARLVAKLTILEHTDLRVAELGSRVEQLLQKYLESEQIRTQQASQIAELRQEIIVMKSRMNN